ncbi:hypothetical protein [Bradyrhizobium japonicum]|uniref:hypothetical protein n=1 Tax=Bradyrhizobium japonicum TaxID=375 RepID=UPI0004B78D79
MRREHSLQAIRTIANEALSTLAHFVNVMHSMNVTPHVAQNTSGPQLCDGRRTPHGCYAVS